MYLGTQHDGTSLIRHQTPHYNHYVCYKLGSFGVVLWELMTGSIPYEGIGALRVIALVAQQGPNLPIPEGVPIPVAQLISVCTHPDPDKRFVSHPAN
jgi:serine/threonine protein kinase